VTGLQVCVRMPVCCVGLGLVPEPCVLHVLGMLCVLCVLDMMRMLICCACCACCVQLAETPCETLGDVSEEVALKLALWQGQAELEQLAGSWREAAFETLKVQEMEEAVAR
jgi:hypothetical protein